MIRIALRHSRSVRSLWSGVRAIALGIAALAILFTVPQRLAAADRAQTARTNVPPSIVFSPSLPDSWHLLETKQLADGTGNSVSRVIVRSKDQHWIVIVSTLGQRVRVGDQEDFLKSWRSSLIEALRKDYGTNIVEDGFSVEQINGRRVAQFRGRAKDLKANVTLFNRTWFESETCIASQVYCDNQQLALENREVATLLDRITLSRQGK
jgi:hypothetical protein